MSSSEVSADWRTYGPPDLSRVLAAALEAFAEHGYHGTSLRDLAGASGLSVAGIYHHYRSKQEILCELMMVIMDELLAHSHASLSSIDGGPNAQFDGLVECLLRFHMARRQQAFVASSEIRSLEGENRTRYVARRDEQQRLMDTVVDTGVRSGAFGTTYPRDASRAVITLCVGVATWYRQDGALSVDEVLVRYGQIARAIVGAG